MRDECLFHFCRRDKVCTQFSLNFMFIYNILQVVAPLYGGQLWRQRGGRPGLSSWLTMRCAAAFRSSQMKESKEVPEGEEKHDEFLVIWLFYVYIKT